MPKTHYSDISLSKDDQVLAEVECFPEPMLTMDISTQQRVSVHFTDLTRYQHCSGCSLPTANYTTLDYCFGNSSHTDHCDRCVCLSKPTCHSITSDPMDTTPLTNKEKKESVPLIRKSTELNLDLIYYGWLKSVRIVSIWLRGSAMFMHKHHTAKGILKKPNCAMCNAQEATDGDKLEMGKIFRRLAKEYLFKQETRSLLQTIPKKSLDNLTETKDANGFSILMAEGRLNEENAVTQSNLDFDIFFDNTEIHTFLPLVSAKSQLFFSFTMYVHNNVRPHSGVESTVREIYKTMSVIDNPRQIIQRIRRDCPRCRMIAKKTLELRMSHHPSARTHITPPFYHCQMDTVYGFKGQPWKNARTSIPIYALMIVCMLTSATNILVLEGLETQDVVQALERHSSRHGVPAVVYVDNGTQLIALQNTEFSLRDVNAHVQDKLSLQKAMKQEVELNPKSKY